MRLLGLKLFVALTLLFCCACVTSPEIDTPREVLENNSIVVSAANAEFDISLQAVAALRPQDMVLIDNQFVCQVNTESDPPLLRISAELQNRISQQSVLSLNSLFFRTGWIRADGRSYSLSGDPENPGNEFAAKLILSSFEGELADHVPLQRNPAVTKDNFFLRLRSGASQGELIGELNLKTDFVLNDSRLTYAGAQVNGTFRIVFR